MIIKQHCKAPTEHIKGRCVSLCVYVSSHYQVTVLSHSWTIIPSLRVLLTVKITLLRRPWVLCWVTPAAVLAHTLHTLRSKMMSAIHNNKRVSACVTCVVCNVYSYQSRSSIGTRGETHIASTKQWSLSGTRLNSELSSGGSTLMWVWCCRVEMEYEKDRRFMWSQNNLSKAFYTLNLAHICINAGKPAKIPEQTNKKNK